MPATIWRLTGLTLPQDHDLRITGVQLWAGDTDVTAQAAVSSSFTPSEGELTALIDGDAGTACSWAAQQVRLPGFYIAWTFAAAVEITRIFIGTSVYTAVLSGGGSTISTVGSVAGGVSLGVTPWRAKEALDYDAVGFWTLTEPGSNQTDEVAGVRNATRAGGVIVPAQLASDRVQAFDPQGAGLIRIPSVTGLDAAGFSVCFDFQFTTAENTVIVEHGSDNKGWSIQSTSVTLAAMWQVPTGVLAVPIGGLESVWFTKVAVNDGKPHRLVMTVDAAGFGVLYLDGQLVTLRGSTAAGVAKPRYNTSYIDIGSRNGGVGLPTGSRIANFALFDRVLSASEVRLMSSTVDWQIHTDCVTTTVAIKGLDPLPQTLGSIASSEPVQVLDIEFGGQHKVYGTVKRKNEPVNTPLRRRVRLHRSRDGMLVRETWSKSDGTYEFLHITDRYEYDTVAWDHEMLQRSVIANNLKPEPM